MKNEELVLNNMGLVGHIAKKYLNTRCEYDDLVQEGTVGLIVAAEKFDPERNCRFSALAGVCIENSIRRYVRSQKKHRRCVLSLDQKVCEDGSRLEELVGTQEDGFEDVWKRDLLVRTVRALAPREREIIQAYYFDGTEQKELAGRYGFSQPDMSRRLKKILAKMRRAAER